MHSTIESDGQNLHRWQIGPSSFWVHPDKGARLMRWDVEMADGSVREILYWPEGPDWEEAGRIRGGNPILFPFAARSFVAGEIGQWKSPNGPLPMPNHGYARQGFFSLENAARDGFICRFVPDDETRKGYPFDYNFFVSYRFEDLALSVSLTLENNDERSIPWSAGHHFYFTLPWHVGLERSHYVLELPKCKAFRQDTRGHLLEDKNFTLNDRFGSDDVNDRIHAKFKKPSARFGPAGGEEWIELSWQDSEGPSAWHSLVTWTESPSSPFYCVEPWMGPPNSAETTHGLHWVAPGKSQTYTVRIALA